MISENGRGSETSRTRWTSAGRWKNLAKNIWVHIMNVAADGTVTTAGQVNLPLDKTGFVLDEARVKGIDVGPKMSYLEVLSRSARIHH
jgi:hypothetical protein